MKKSNLIKVCSILLISVMVLTFHSTVMAATDLTDTLNNGTNNAANNANAANNSNTNTNNMNSNANRTNNANSNASNNSSIYNNTNLPYTGIEDTISVAVLVVIFGISAVYAYKKINEYKNI